MDAATIQELAIGAVIAVAAVALAIVTIDNALRLYDAWAQQQGDDECATDAD